MQTWPMKLTCFTQVPLNVDQVGKLLHLEEWFVFYSLTCTMSHCVVFRLFCYSLFQPRCIFMWWFHQTTHARCHCFRFGFLGTMKEQIRLMNMSGLVFASAKDTTDIIHWVPFATSKTRDQGHLPLPPPPEKDLGPVGRGTPSPTVDRHTPVKTVLSPSFGCERLLQFTFIESVPYF